MTSITSRVHIVQKDTEVTVKQSLYIFSSNVIEDEMRRDKNETRSKPISVIHSHFHELVRRICWLLVAPIGQKPIGQIFAFLLSRVICSRPAFWTALWTDSYRAHSNNHLFFDFFFLWSMLEKKWCNCWLLLIVVYFIDFKFPYFGKLGSEDKADIKLRWSCNVPVSVIFRTGLFEFSGDFLGVWVVERGGGGGLCVSHGMVGCYTVKW